MSNIQLLTINEYDLPNPTKGNLTIVNKARYNEYECEDGSIKIEPIKEKVVDGVVKFKGLFEDEVRDITSHLSLISTLTLYSPIEDEDTVEIQALITAITVNNIVTTDGVKAWSLSFKFNELDR